MGVFMQVPANSLHLLEGQLSWDEGGAPAGATTLALIVPTAIFSTSPTSGAVLKLAT